MVEDSSTEGQTETEINTEAKTNTDATETQENTEASSWLDSLVPLGEHPRNLRTGVRPEFAGLHPQWGRQP